MNRRSFLSRLVRGAIAGAVASSVRWLPMPEAPKLPVAHGQLCKDVRHAVRMANLSDDDLRELGADLDATRERVERAFYRDLFEWQAEQAKIKARGL